MEFDFKGSINLCSLPHFPRVCTVGPFIIASVMQASNFLIIKVTTRSVYRLTKDISGGW